MIERISLKIFTVMMLSCASLALIGVWFGEGMPEYFFKTIFTTFVIGLASFLIWVPLVTYRYLKK